MRLGTTRFPPAVTGFLCTLVWYTLCTPSLAQKDTLPVESSLSFDPLVRLLGCLREDRPGFCFQKRALGYFESWLTTSEDENDDTFDSDGSEEQLPAGISPQWNKLMDQVAERISSSYSSGKDDDDDDEEEDDEQSDDGKSRDNKLQKRDSTDVEDGRGHKKKKVKAIKKALIKLVLIALLIKSKLKILLTAFQTFLGLKGAVLITILVITHAIKLWAEIKHHQIPQKVIYYENAHHQHHYDHDHEDHHSGWGLWGRSGVEATTPGGPLSQLASFFSRRDDSSDLAYAGYKPYNDRPEAPSPMGHPGYNLYSDRPEVPSLMGYPGYPTTENTDRYPRSFPSSESPRQQDQPQ